jgi:glycosyltransferase involved in cell wall biosynthesis
MADAAIAFAKDGHEVWFIAVEPTKEFFNAKGRETLIQLLAKEKSTVKIISAPAGYEFEFGTPEYRTYVYKTLITKLPPGVPIIVSDDKAVWEAATSLYTSYPVVGVLHADEEQYYHLAEKYHNRVATLVCVSNRINRLVTKRIPAFDPAHIFTIPCGIKLPSIEFNGQAAGILQLVYVGRVSNYQKRAGDQAKICASLAEKGIKFHLNVIGDGDAKGSLEQAITESGLQQYVTFYGWLSQKDVAIHLSESDILLLTSDFEGTPIAMMEALATGCGMVGTRVSGIEDYEDHPLAKDCLGIYTVGDIEDAVNKIIKVAQIPKKSRQQSARKIAETEFSMKVCMNRYLIAIATIHATITTHPKISLPVKAKLYSSAIAFARNLKISLKKK